MYYANTHCNSNMHLVCSVWVWCWHVDGHAQVSDPCSLPVDVAADPHTEDLLAIRQRDALELREGTTAKHNLMVIITVTYV